MNQLMYLLGVGGVILMVIMILIFRAASRRKNRPPFDREAYVRANRTKNLFEYLARTQAMLRESCEVGRDFRRYRSGKTVAETERHLQEEYQMLLADVPSDVEVVPGSLVTFVAPESYEGEYHGYFSIMVRPRISVA